MWLLLIGLLFCVFVGVPALFLLPHYVLSSHINWNQSVFADILDVWRWLVSTTWSILTKRFRV